MEQDVFFLCILMIFGSKIIMGILKIADSEVKVEDEKIVHGDGFMCGTNKIILISP